MKLLSAVTGAIIYYVVISLVLRLGLKILGLGLEDRLTAKVGLLSGGQRQALTLLMATLKKSKLLLS